MVDLLLSPVEPPYAQLVDFTERDHELSRWHLQHFNDPFFLFNREACVKFLIVRHLDEDHVAFRKTQSEEAIFELEGEVSPEGVAS